MTYIRSSLKTSFAGWTSSKQGRKLELAGYEALGATLAKVWECASDYVLTKCRLATEYLYETEPSQERIFALYRLARVEGARQQGGLDDVLLTL